MNGTLRILTVFNITLPQPQPKNPEDRCQEKTQNTGPSCCLCICLCVIGLSRGVLSRGMKSFVESRCSEEVVKLEFWCLWFACVRVAWPRTQRPGSWFHRKVTRHCYHLGTQRLWRSVVAGGLRWGTSPLSRLYSDPVSSPHLPEGLCRRAGRGVYSQVPGVIGWARKDRVEMG